MVMTSIVRRFFRSLDLGSLGHATHLQQIIFGDLEAHTIDIDLSIDGLLVTVPQHRD